jgi:hypothetical protein
MKTLQRFLWWCAGAHTEILEKYPTEWGKYFGIGGTIVFTALMASFAGGYAFFTAFHDLALACFFGVFWGALIFNLDRYIVSSIGKGDGTARITKEEFQNAIPRLILAVLIGFVVSTPLELKVFEREIEVEIQEIINEKRQKMVAGLNDLRGEQQRLKDRISELQTSEEEIGADMGGDDPRIKVADQKIETLRQQESGIQKKLNANESKQRNISNEIARLEGQSSPGDIAALKRKQSQLSGLENDASRLKSELSQTRSAISVEGNAITNVKGELGENYGKLKSQNNSKIETLNNHIADIDTIYQNKAKGFKDQSEKYNGFMARLEAIDRLSIETDTIYSFVTSSNNSEGASATQSSQRQISGIEENYTVVWYAKWMMALLLIAIEIAPILFKMMTESGPYDDRVEEIKYASEIEKKKFISDLNQRINTDLKIGQQINDQKLQAELQGNQDLLKMIASSQAEIIAVAIEKWKEGELLKAREKPEAYIKSSNGI